MATALRERPTGWPAAQVLFTNSTIDAYGRATLLDPGETVNDRDLLHEVLQGKAPPGEGFDTDLMFWANGWATLFSAVHIVIPGTVYLIHAAMKKSLRLKSERAPRTSY
jgi:hypothetical protein